MYCSKYFEPLYSHRLKVSGDTSVLSHCLDVTARSVPRYALAIKTPPLLTGLLISGLVDEAVQDDPVALELLDLASPSPASSGCVFKYSILCNP